MALTAVGDVELSAADQGNHSCGAHQGGVVGLAKLLVGAVEGGGEGRLEGGGGALDLPPALGLLLLHLNGMPGASRVSGDERELTSMSARENGTA